MSGVTARKTEYCSSGVGEHGSARFPESTGGESGSG